MQTNASCAINCVLYRLRYCVIAQAGYILERGHSRQTDMQTVRQTDATNHFSHAMADAGVINDGFDLDLIMNHKRFVVTQTIRDSYIEYSPNVSAIVTVL